MISGVTGNPFSSNYYYLSFFFSSFSLLIPHLSFFLFFFLYSWEIEEEKEIIIIKHPHLSYIWIVTVSHCICATVKICFWNKEKKRIEREREKKGEKCNSFEFFPPFGFIFSLSFPLYLSSSLIPTPCCSLILIEVQNDDHQQWWWSRSEGVRNKRTQPLLSLEDKGREFEEWKSSQRDFSVTKKSGGNRHSFRSLFFFLSFSFFSSLHFPSHPPLPHTNHHLFTVQYKETCCSIVCVISYSF